MRHGACQTASQPSPKRLCEVGRRASLLPHSQLLGRGGEVGLAATATSKSEAGITPVFHLCALSAGDQRNGPEATRETDCDGSQAGM